MSREDTALVVFAHGSSIESANDAVRDVGRALADAGGYRVEAAFLGGGVPDLAGAVRKLVDGGVRQVVVAPYFLTLGLHLQRDLPQLVDEVGAQFPEIRLAVTLPLDGHPLLVQILLDRAASAMDGDGT